MSSFANKTNNSLNMPPKKKGKKGDYEGSGNLGAGGIQ